MPIAIRKCVCTECAMRGRESSIISVDKRGVAIERSAAEGIRMAAEEDSTVEAPADTPSMPSPAEAEERRDREAKAERNTRAAKSPPGIEPRPQADRVSVHIGRVVSGHIHHIRISRLDVYIRPLFVHALLRRTPQIARAVSLVTHV